MKASKGQSGSKTEATVFCGLMGGQTSSPPLYSGGQNPLLGQPTLEER